MKTAIKNFLTTLNQKFNRPGLADNDLLSAYSESHDYPIIWFENGSTFIEVHLPAELAHMSSTGIDYLSMLNECH